MDNLGFNDSSFGEVLSFRGNWGIEHVRAGKVIGNIDFKNLVLNAGKTSILDTMFNAVAQVAANSWFAGLINAAGYTTIVAADTIASHAGWVELTTYAPSTRPLWGQGAAASQNITNAGPIVFTANAPATVQGLFIVSQSTKGGTTGLMWSAGVFTTPLPVVNLDELRCTYNLAT